MYHLVSPVTEWGAFGVYTRRYQFFLNNIPVSHMNYNGAVMENVTIQSSDTRKYLQ